MKTIEFIDTTLRDGHQSLWATRMRTAHMVPVAHLLDKAGFQSVELMGTVHFDACLRYLREDPWERIQILSYGPAAHTPGSIDSKQIADKLQHCSGLSYFIVD